MSKPMGDTPNRHQNLVSNEESQPHCAVVIPTKNAMPGLERVIAMVIAQKTPWPFEVIVIDSGSTDGTVEYVKRHSTLKLIEIAPETFGHGRTRNEAAAATKAPFIAFLTHDAVPLTEYWLSNIVSVAEQAEHIAGVFGRHVAYEDASPFIKRDLDRHFDGFLVHPHIVNKDTDAERYKTDEGWRQFLHFYSDNNSLLRRSVWAQIPYPDVEFAEDQLWARAIIDAGYSKAYADEATVIHSHDYTPLEQLRRAFDEARNFKKYFDYRLSPTLKHVFWGAGKTIVSALRDDIDQKRYGPVTLRSRLSRALTQSLTIFGHFLGSHHKKLPKMISKRLSLDEKLFRE